MAITNFPYGVSSFGTPVVGGGGYAPIVPGSGKYWFVDADNGSDVYDGTKPDFAFATIQAAVTAASGGDVIFVYPKNVAAGGTDPESYAETIIIPAATDRLSIIGVPALNRTQGGLPQIKIGAGTTAMLTVRAPNCLIANLGFNGASSTGGGILLDDDGSTKSAFGTTIVNCHFKNCKGSTSKAASGGAIYWSSSGGAWQVRIADCNFYDNICDISLVGTGVSRPKDVIVENCVFWHDTASSQDCNIYGCGGSGFASIGIRNCEFGTVDVPSKGSGDADLYLKMTGSAGFIFGCRFACTGKTFGDNAGVNAAFIPTTMRMGSCYQENAIITRTS